jgi:CheY-like chemotaxis protein
LDGARTTVVGILGDDPLVSRVLGLLLEGAGYEARALEEAAVLEHPSASLVGVDLVLFTPLLGEQRGDALLGAVKGSPETANVPVLRLSTELNEGTDSVLPWPWSTEALAQAIERALHASGGGATP